MHYTVRKEGRMWGWVKYDEDAGKEGMKGYRT